MMMRLVGGVAIFGLVVGCAAAPVEEEGALATEQGITVGGDENCKVSCNAGTYACCNENGEGTDTCQCVSDGVITGCDVGGYGASSCESPGYGGKAAKDVKNADAARAVVVDRATRP